MKKIYSLLTTLILITFINAGFSETPKDIFNLDTETLSGLANNFPTQNIVPANSHAIIQSQTSGKVPVHGYTAAQKEIMKSHNKNLLLKYISKGIAVKGEVKYRPYADYEKTGFLIMSSAFNFSSRQAKLEMAKNLPSDAFLVIFANTADAARKESIQNDYSEVISKDRIKVIKLENAGYGFWARDGIPVPVMDESDKLTVVDAKYYHRFEPDARISEIFQAGIEKHDNYFEGGNFQANSKGICVIVNNEQHSSIPDFIFNNMYGCKDIIRLPHLSGIGHVDEHARFINDTTIVTDLEQYKKPLEEKGLTVHMLPRPSTELETYVNSLIMNDRVIVPVFDEPTDAQALAVYESLGLKAFGADSKRLSNSGMGSVHCITMTYPKVPLTELLKALDATELQ